MTLVLAGGWRTPPVTHGVSPWAGTGKLLAKFGAGTSEAVMAGVTAAEDTIVVQRVVVVAAALTAALGWGTAGAGL